MRIFRFLCRVEKNRIKVFTGRFTKFIVLRLKNISYENMPQNAQKVAAGKNDDDKSENLINLHEHECLQNRVVFRLDIFLDRFFQLVVVVGGDALLDSSDV